MLGEGPPSGDRVHLQCVDLTEQNPFPDDTFDRIGSRPSRCGSTCTTRASCWRRPTGSLKPGGLQWIRANLWAGPQASHRYRDIYFPWPHHLFSDAVIAEWGRPATAATRRAPRG